MGKVGIHIIEPAGTPDRAALSRNIVDLERRGFRVRHTATPSFSAWSYASGSATDRYHALHDALCNDDIEYVVAARGGYGASDLLPLVDWDRLSKAKPKCLVGLSSRHRLSRRLTRFSHKLSPVTLARRCWSG